MATTLTRLCTLLLCITPLASNAIDWYSSTSNQCWKHEKQPKWASAPTASTVVEISNDRAQVIDGLGGTFNVIIDI